MSTIIVPRSLGQPLNLGPPSTKGLVFYWRGIYAGNVVDESLFRNHGTIIGPTWVGGGLDFDGATDKVTVPHSDSLNITGEITILVDQRPAALGLDQTLVGKSGKNQYWFEFFNAKLRFFTGGIAYTTTDNVSAASGERSVVGVTYSDSGDFFHFIKNGKIIETVTPVATMVSSTDPVYIGIDPRDGIGLAYEGLIYSISIYNRLLSVSEYQQLYINPDLPMQREPVWLGSVSVAPPTANPVGPLGHPLYGPFAGPIAC